MHFTLLREYPSVDLLTLWRDFMGRADFASHYTSPEFFLDPFITEARPFAVLAVDRGRVLGVATGHHGRRATVCGGECRPQIAFALDADKLAVSEVLVQGLLAEAGRDSLITLYAWQPLTAFSTRGYRVRQQAGVVMLDLGLGPEALFAAFSKHRRNNIRKATKSGVEVYEPSSDADYRAYYDIFVDWSRRKHQTPYSYDVMRRAFSLTAHRRLFLARHEGRVVAGSVVRMYPGGVVEYAANSSLESALHARPNDLIQWRAIEWACANKYTRYSLGGSHLFLRQFGGSVVPTYRHQRDRSLSRHHELRELLVEAARSLRHVIRSATASGPSAPSKP